MNTMRVRAKFVASRREAMPNDRHLVCGQVRMPVGCLTATPSARARRGVDHENAPAGGVGVKQADLPSWTVREFASGVGGGSSAKHRGLVPCRSQDFEREGRVEDYGSVGRAGTSLTEVLMSLMIMSIGVVSVATLFPISALRTLEANKQTNSTIARFTAEALVDVDPQVVHNPDGVHAYPGAAAGVSDSTPYNSAISVAQAGTSQPTFRGQTYLVDPIGWQGFNEDPLVPGSPLASPFSAYPSPLSSPRDFFGNTAPAVVNWPLTRRYTAASLFSAPYPSTAAGVIAAKARAAALVAQPDNWKVMGEGQFVDSIPPGATTAITGVSLDNDANLQAVSPASVGVYRAVIYDVDGNHSEVRYGITVAYNAGLNAWEVTWLDPLPARFNSPGAGLLPNIGKVRVEVADQVYTWTLTVRKRSSGPASVDVVVYFKRNFDPNNERVFDGEFRKWKLWRDAQNDYDGTPAQRQPGVSGVNDNGVNGVDDVGEIGYPGIYSIEQDVPNGTVTIKVPSGALDDERPKVRRGGYVFDTKNGLWYRVRAVQNKVFGVGPGSNEDWVDVVLDESIRLDSTEDLNGSGTLDLAGEDRNNNGTIDRGGVIVHPNVVNVFPLEIKEP
ncbi:MAG: hypothetical protein ACKV2Q_23180 [Planctomycetaceae bacterium]